MAAIASLGRVRVILVVVLLMTGLFDPGAVFAKKQPHGDNPGYAYDLKSTAGRRVTEATFLGRPQAVTFGFASCPDVCPTTLSALSSAVRQLGPQGKKIAIVFISVDPGRDTPAVLQSYAKAFGPNITALTGSKLQIDDAVAAFHARYQFIQDGTGGYDVAHTGLVYLIDKTGTLRVALPATTTAQQYVIAFRKILAAEAIK